MSMVAGTSGGGSLSAGAGANTTTSSSSDRLRRWLPPRDLCTHLLGLFLYGVQQVMGYLLMLVVMTYQTELFVMVVLGLVVGHAVFNLGTSVGESADMCCQRGEAAGSG